ncbi:MAG: hydrogenase [Ideonella sp.]|nr:hydrogenase [Ideonella sp.]
MTVDAPTLTEAPLVQRLVTQFGAEWVDSDNLAAFRAGPGERVLFFSGDPVRFPECLDVAVVLPELQAVFPGRLRIGVVRREHEDAVAARFGANRWPCLVFLRDGQYVTLIAGMLDWTDYVERVRQALVMPTTRTPGIGIAVVGAGAADAASCH